MGSDHELAAITEAHNARMAGIDPLIPPGAVVPAVGDEFAITVDGGSAVARTQHAEAASLDALWGALTTYTLSGIRVGADRPAAAVMEDLLTGWHAWVAEQPADSSGDTAASLMWPSRDVEPVNTFLAHGMTPRIAIAARPAGRAIPPAPDQDVPIRPIEDRDLEGAVARYLDVVGWDASRLPGHHVGRIRSARRRRGIGPVPDRAPGPGRGRGGRDAAASLGGQPAVHAVLAPKRLPSTLDQL